MWLEMLEDLPSLVEGVLVMTFILLDVTDVFPESFDFDVAPV